MPRSAPDADALVGPLYLVAIFLVLTPAIDFITSVLPLQPGQIEWRFGSFGLLSGFLLTPLLGLVLAMFVAVWAEHYGVLRSLSFLVLIASLVLLGGLAMFALDVLQLRSVVRDEARAAFKGSALKATVKYLTFLVAALWLGRAGLRVVSRVPKPLHKSAPTVVR